MAYGLNSDERGQGNGKSAGGYFNNGELNPLPLRAAKKMPDNFGNIILTKAFY